VLTTWKGKLPEDQVKRSVERSAVWAYRSLTHQRRCSVNDNPSAGQLRLLRRLAQRDKHGDFISCGEGSGGESFDGSVRLLQTGLPELMGTRGGVLLRCRW